jgi:hypothetical protein
LTWTPPWSCASGRDAGLDDHGGDDLAEESLLLSVGQGAARVEGLLRAQNGQLSVDHPRADCREYFAQLCLGPDGAEEARAGADHRHGLPAQAVAGKGTGGPVERVLERARQRGVVLRRRDENRVGRSKSPRNRLTAGCAGSKSASSL